MNGICLIWSRGGLISPSLPVVYDRYLNLSSPKRPTGRNLVGNCLVRRSGTTSRGTVVLVFSLRMCRFHLTLVLTIFVGMKWNTIFVGMKCGVTVGANLLLNVLVFNRLRTPMTVEADILNSLIVFYNWFCERATAEADFLGSCRKYILSLISHVSCWRSTKIFSYFSLSISTLILWAIDC